MCSCCFCHCGPPGPRGPPGPNQTPILASEVPCDSLVSFNSGLSRLEYGAITPAILADADSLVFCKQGQLSSTLVQTTLEIPSTASIFYSDNMGNIERAAIQPSIISGCPTTYLVIESGAIKARNIGFAYANAITDQTITGQGVVNFVGGGLPGLECSEPTWTTSWSPFYSAARNFLAVMSCVSAVAQTVTWEIRRDGLPFGSAKETLQAGAVTQIVINAIIQANIGQVFTVEQTLSTSPSDAVLYQNRSITWFQF